MDEHREDSTVYAEKPTDAEEVYHEKSTDIEKMYTEKSIDEDKMYAEKSKDMEKVNTTCFDLSGIKIFELILLFLSMVLRGLGLDGLGPIILDLEQILHTDLNRITVIFITQQIGYIIGSVISETLFVRFNFEILMASSVVLISLATAAIPASSLLSVTSMLFLVQGCALGLQYYGCIDSCFKLGGQKRGGLFVNMVSMGILIGSVGTPAIIQHYMSHRNSTGQQLDMANQHINISQSEIDAKYWNFGNMTETHIELPYLIVGLLHSLTGIGFLILYSKKKDETLKSGELFFFYKPKQESEEKYSFSRSKVFFLLLALSISAVCLQSTLFHGIHMVNVDLLTTFLFFATGNSRASKSRAVGANILFQLAFAMVRIINVWVSRHLSPIVMLLISACIIVGASFTSEFITLFYTNLGDKHGIRVAETVELTYSVAMGIGTASFSQATIVWIVSNLPKLWRGLALTAFSIGASLGAILFPVLVALLASFKYVTELYLFSGTSAIIGLTILIVMQQSMKAFKELLNEQTHHRYSPCKDVERLMETNSLNKAASEKKLYH